MSQQNKRIVLKIHQLVGEGVQQVREKHIFAYLLKWSYSEIRN